MCKYCDKTFRYEYHLKTHIKEVHEIKQKKKNLIEIRTKHMNLLLMNTIQGNGPQ